MLFIIKIIILFVILLLCTQIGILKAKTYDNRVIRLKQLKNALEMMRSKIEFTYEPIKDIFEEISKIIYLQKDNIFKNAVNLMSEKSVNDSWILAVENENSFNDEDKSTIKMFGKLLGKTDKSGQINEINLTSKLIDNLIEKAENEKSKNYKLFRTLGVVIGMGVCIILV